MKYHKKNSCCWLIADRKEHRERNKLPVFFCTDCVVCRKYGSKLRRKPGTKIWPVCWYGLKCDKKCDMFHPHHHDETINACLNTRRTYWKMLDMLYHYRNNIAHLPDLSLVHEKLTHNCFDAFYHIFKFLNRGRAES